MMLRSWVALTRVVSVLHFTSLLIPASAVEEPASSSVNSSQIVANVFPYGFPDEDYTTNLFPMMPCNGLVLEEASIDILQEYMSHERLTSAQLVACYMQRAFQVDQYVKYVV